METPKGGIVLLVGAGESLDGVRRSGLLQRAFSEICAAARLRSHNDHAKIVFYADGATVYPSIINLADPGNIIELQAQTMVLHQGSWLAAGLDAARALLTLGTPGVIVVLSDFQDDDPDGALEALKRITDSGGVFVKNFRVSDHAGGSQLAQRMDDAQDAGQDTCDTVHYTNDKGELVESTAATFGRELDMWLHEQRANG